MQASKYFLYKSHRIVKSIFLLLFLLLSANYHQALNKNPEDFYSNADFRFLYQPVVVFSEDYVHYLNENLDHLLKRRGFNGTALVSHKGKEVFSYTSGYANIPQRVLFEEQETSIFQLASVSKQFTAVSVLMLQERDLIDIDDPVYKYIAGFPYEEIKIRHLLNHTSGLHNYMYYLDNYWKEERMPDHSDLLHLFEDYEPGLNFSPGRRFGYSNTAYAFLGLLVECVSGKSFAEFMQSEIFTPLHMEHSFVYDPLTGYPEHLLDYIVEGHRGRSRWARAIPDDFVDGVTGDKGVFASAKDLLKWDNALNFNILISEESLQQATSRTQTDRGFKLNYGFGYRIRPHGSNQHLAYHNGWWRGFRTSYLRLPESNTLVLLLNNTDASINGLDRQIQNIVEDYPYSYFAEEAPEKIATTKTTNPIQLKEHRPQTLIDFALVSSGSLHL